MHIIKNPPMKIIDGKAVANEYKNTLKLEVQRLIKSNQRPPHLAAIIVGDNAASQTYVRNKVKACHDVGFESTVINLDNDTTESQLLDTIHKLNTDNSIDGFIVQLPLPVHINETNVLLSIDPKKDVDGFHPINFGRMAQGLDAYIPATPYGITLLLDRYNIETSGKHVVVVGRSNIVGTPISILLSRKSKLGDATVTLTHSKTKNLADHLKNADIIIAAIGIPGFITEEMVGQNTVIIDVGINRIVDELDKDKSKLVGDVAFETVKFKSSHITPVPGGVGPMTVIGLLINTLKAAKKEVYGQS